MSEGVFETELPPSKTETFPRNEFYLVVCSHGRSRSKFIARQLDQLGYDNVQILGLRDSYLDRQERIQLLKQAKAIVCASPTDLAEIKHILNHEAEAVILLTVDVPELDHFVLSSQALVGKKTEAVKAAINTIKDRLIALGFSETI